MEAWTMEPDDDAALPQSWNGSPLVRPAEKMYQLSASDDRNLLLQQAAMAQRGLRPQASAGDFWNLSAEDKGGGKKKKKKDKKAKSAVNVTSPPWLQNGNIFHFNSMGTLNFQVEHLGTVKVDQSDVQRNPYNSIKRVKDLVTRGEGWVRDVVLMVTDSEVIMKEDSTQENLKRFPMGQIQMCKYLSDEDGGVLMLCVQSGDAHNPDIHVFQCTMTPAKMICEEINDSIQQYFVRSQDRRKNKGPGFFGERRFNAAPPMQLSEADRWQLAEQQLRQCGIIDTEERHNDENDYGEESDARLRYARSIMSRPRTSSTAGMEMKRTLKAAKIQRDVDILNHLMDDLEDFIASVHERAAAWQELEKKKKKSKKRKGDAALELLMMKAQPPAEADYVVVYQKCKYAINLVSKLGHHLSSPTASELLQGLFGLLGELIRSNNGTHLAASVEAPLITKRAIHLMLTSLSKKNAILWRQLGEHWMTTSDRWPASRGAVPVYLVKFADGCIPPNLHNASDCPSNFPTLDPIPVGKRNSNYSDAYDEDYQGGMDDEHLNNQSSLRINPAVIEAEACKAAASTSHLPNVFPFQQSAKENAQSISSSAVQFGSQEGQKVAKVIINFTATSDKELTITRGELVTVLNDTRNWWLVKNRQGRSGFVPSNMLELLSTKQARDAGKQDEESVFFHGKVVPARPNQPPPPVPMAPASPPQPSEANKAGLSRRSQSSMLAPPSTSVQPLPPLQEIAEESSGPTLKPSTASDSSMLRASLRRKDFPTLSPPPDFAPAPPPVTKPSSVSSPQLTRRPSAGNITVQPPAPPIPTSEPQPPPAGHPFSSVPAPPPPPGPAAGAPPPPPPPPPPVVPPQNKSMSEMIQQHKLKTRQEQEQNGGGHKKSVQEQMQFNITKELSNMKPLRKVSKQQLDIEQEKTSPMDEDLQERLQQRRQGNADNESGRMGSVMLKFDAEPKDVKLWLISQGFANCVPKLGKLTGEELYNMERDEIKKLCGINNAARIYSQLQRDYAKAEREAMADEESSHALRTNRKSRQPAALSRAKKDVKIIGRPKRGSIQRRKSLSSESDQSDDEKDKHRRRRNRRKEAKKKSKDSKEEKEKQKKKKESSENTKAKKKGHKRHESSSSSDDESDNKHKKKNKKHHKRHHGSESSDSDSDSSTDSDYSSDSTSSSDSEEEQNAPDKKASAGQWALGEGDMLQSAAETSEIIKNQQKTLQKQLQQMQQLQKQLNITSLPAEERLPLQEHLLKLQQLQLELQREPNNRQVQMNLLKQQQDLQQHLIIVQQNLITMAATKPKDEPVADEEESQDEPEEPPAPDPVLLQQQQHLQLQAQQLAIQQHQVRQLYAHLHANAQQQAAEHMRRAQQQAQVEAQIRMETQARMAAHQQMKAQQQARIAQLQAQIHSQQHMLHQHDMLGPASAMYTPMATGQFY